MRARLEGEAGGARGKEAPKRRAVKALTELVELRSAVRSAMLEVEGIRVGLLGTGDRCRDVESEPRRARVDPELPFVVTNECQESRRSKWIGSHSDRDTARQSR